MGSCVDLDFHSLLCRYNGHWWYKAKALEYAVLEGVAAVKVGYCGKAFSLNQGFQSPAASSSLILTL